ncbi:hypothetical protein NQ315_010810 [Exocentrus adspersus]|uniref:Uncharacterized protein n=1 Tax=Exocentrus adspersus TaxID=1586481 RepID=A0AAV8V9S7_9CUCU|nr:hypothetical protein NQ315_010810 [Exocentrus adspersus]
MPKEYFRNPFEDYSKETAKELIENNSISPKSKISLGLNSKWQATLDKFQNLDYNDYSVYTGTSGVALLKLKKEHHCTEEKLQEIINLLSLNRLRNRRYTYLCGDAGPLSIAIVLNHKLNKSNEVKLLTERLKSMETDILNMNVDIPNEYLYGRAGYLYAILYVNRNVAPPPFGDAFIRSIIETMLMCGQNSSKAGGFKCPLMYQWHDSYYLGAAHGLSGILYMLLQVWEYLSQEELDNLIKPTIDYLTTQRFESGNFPSSLGRDRDKYVQWCHGAPGFLYLYTTAYKVFHDPIYLQLAQDCGDIIWQRGLLKKGYSLCHGVSGNAYCFLELYQATKDEKHLYRAIKFAEWCLDYTSEHEQHRPDRPLSLYEGIAGPMYLLLDIQKPMEAKFPGFTL